jgi:hypothetical protein
MENKTFERVLYAFDSWMGHAAKEQLIRAVHSEVSSGRKLNLSEMHQKMNIRFYNTVRMVVALTLFPFAGIALFDAYGLEPNVSLKLLFMACFIGGSALIWRALAIRFRKVEFQKSPLGDELHAFLSGANGHKRLRQWGDESAEIHRFMVANKIYEEFSTFEYELVESFRREQATLQPTNKDQT